MAGNDSSWADQWDFNPAPSGPETTKKTNNSGGGAKAKYGKKVGEGLSKTKAVASTGMKKVKQGTSAGLVWIKEKYQKTTQKA